MTFRSSISWTTRCHWLLEDLHFGILKGYWYIWNAGIKRGWYQIFHSKDEHHSSLDMDLYAIIAMNQARTQAYRADLHRRRMQAHEKESF